MHAQISMTLLETIVLADEVQIVTTDYNSPLHLHLTDHSSQDSATNGDVSGEGAFFVDIGSGDGLLGGLETETDAVVQTQALLLVHLFTVQVNTVLLLERTLVLISHLEQFGADNGLKSKLARETPSRRSPR